MKSRSIAFALLALVMMCAAARAQTPEASTDAVMAILGDAATAFGQRRFDDARAAAVKALAKSEAELGREHPITAMCLNNLGAIELAREQPAAAVPSFTRALAIFEAHHATTEAEQVAEFLAMALQAAGDFSAARPMWERVASNRERTVGAGPELAGDLASLGEVCHALGDLPAARAAFDRSRVLREAALGPDHPETVKTTFLLANTLRAMGDLVAAKPHMMRVAAAYEAVLGAEHPMTLELVTSLALIEHGLGEYKVARTRFERVLTVRKKVLGEQHDDTAQAYNNLGFCLLPLGELERAQDALERALAIRIALHGKDSPENVRNLSNLGVVAHARGDLRRAKTHLEAALAILERQPDTGDRQQAQMRATVLNNLSVVNQALGDWKAAQQNLERALSLRVAALGKNHPETVQAFANLGALLSASGDAKGAKPFLEHALASAEATLGKDHLDVATALDNLGAVHLALGELDLAEQRITRALAIRTAALGKDHPDVALSYNNMATVKQRRGKLREAQTLFEKALAINDLRLGKNHPDTARTLDNLGTVATALGDTRAAIGYLTRAASIEEALLADVLIGGTEAQKLDFAANVEASTHVWISLGLAGGKDGAELAFETVARRKGRVLEAAADQLSLLRAKLPPSQQGLFDALAAARREQASLVLNPPRELAPETARTLAESAAQEGDRLEGELARASEAFASARAPIDRKSLAAARPKGAALIELVVYHPFDAKTGAWSGPHYAAFVLSDSGLSAADLGPIEPIEALASELRKGIAARRSESKIKAMAGLNAVKKTARALFTQLFGPFDKAIAGAHTLLISADGELSQVPFEALMDADGKWLVERYAVSYLTSARGLVPPPRQPARSAPVVLGGVDYEGASGTASTTASTRSADRAFTELHWQFLPGTLAELDGLKQVPALGGATILQGAAADEAALRALHGPKVLHIATHGFFLPDQPEVAAPDAQARASRLGENPLLRSGLALAGANQRDRRGGDDGVLTALEASGLDLQGTELVVLSACETGVGDVRRGDGVLGLARALVLAGARTQVMSLWQVDDDATRALMIAYYQRLARGEGKAEAMRNVRLAMLHGGSDAEALAGDVAVGNGPWSHPFYWAAFLVHGDTGPLR